MRLAILVLLVACESAKPEVTRCLPAVATKCYCTYGCVLGHSKDERTWRIDLNGANNPAVIENYCVEGKCTDVFAVGLECDVVCAPQAANPNCQGQCK